MHYLITGGAGFVGSHLAEELLRRGHEVFVIDDLSTGTILNIRHLKADPRFHYIIDTVANRSLLAELVDGVDIIYHLAAAVGVRLIVESPVRTIETNIKLTELVLEAAHKKKKPVFVASTSECYGKSNDIPFREDGELVLGPTSKGRWSYACSKLIDEFLAIAYFRERQLPTVVKCPLQPSVLAPESGDIGWRVWRQSISPVGMPHAGVPMFSPIVKNASWP